mmetsp:Transcript_32616/g.78375  ORF Transcript_32616/g.78375 Transcript_32616/m.78375 type:complete len:418 (+) Transcript_32616:456-1709(+)
MHPSKSTRSLSTSLSSLVWAASTRAASCRAPRAPASLPAAAARAASRIAATASTLVVARATARSSSSESCRGRHRMLESSNLHPSTLKYRSDTVGAAAAGSKRTGMSLLSSAKRSPRSTVHVVLPGAWVAGKDREPGKPATSVMVKEVVCATTLSRPPSASPNESPILSSSSTNKYSPPAAPDSAASRASSWSSPNPKQCTTVVGHSARAPRSMFSSFSLSRTPAVGWPSVNRNRLRSTRWRSGTGQRWARHCWSRPRRRPPLRLVVVPAWIWEILATSWALASSVANVSGKSSRTPWSKVTSPNRSSARSWDTKNFIAFLTSSILDPCMEEDRSITAVRSIGHRVTCASGATTVITPGSPGLLASIRKSSRTLAGPTPAASPTDMGIHSGSAGSMGSSAATCSQPLLEGASSGRRT